MTVVGEAFIAVRPDGSKFGPEAEKQVAAGLDPVAKRIASVVGGAFVGAKVFGVLKSGLDELKESATVTAQTEAAIKSTGAAANVTSGEVADLAGSLSELSGTDDELIQKGANLLLTFKNVQNQVGEGNDIFDEATAAALDLSTAGFGSMESASVLLGKALNDPVKGVTALQRVGVALTESQKETVKQLVETGDVLGAQKIILAEVESQVGGSAKAFGETLPGQIAKARTSLDNMEGDLVAGLAPAIEIAATATGEFAQFISDLPGPLSTAAGGVLGITAAYFTLARPFNEGITLLRTLGILHETTAVKAQVQAVAETELAVAEGAVATNSAAAVAGLYAQDAALASSGAAFGPWGVAVAGAILLGSQAWDIWGGKVDHNLSDISDLLKQSAQELANSFLFTKWEGNPEDAGKMLAALAKGGEQGIGALKLLRDELVREGQDASMVDEALAGAVRSQQNMNAATREGTQVLAGNEDALKAAAKAEEQFSGLIDGIADGMQKTYDSMFAAVKLTSSYEGSIDDLTDTLKKNGTTTDLTIQKGRENTAALIETGESVAALIEQRFKETHSVEAATAAGDMYVGNLKAQLEAAGYNEDQIASMIQTMNLTPEQIDTIFSNNAAEQQIVIGKYLAALDDIPPEKRTQIETAIEQGDYDKANRLLNDLTSDRTVVVHITTSGTVNIPDLGPDANREFHGSANARGTDWWPGGWSVVGEQGREVVWMPRGSAVIPNNKLHGFASGLNVGSALTALLDRGSSDASPRVRSGDIVQIDVDARGAPDPYAVGRAVGAEWQDRKWRFPER